MKRCWVFLTCMCLILCVITAGASAAEDMDRWLRDVKDKYGGTTLYLSCATHPSTDAFMKVAPEFTRVTGIKLQWDVITETELRLKQLSEYTAKSGRYDILMVDGAWLSEYCELGVLEQLTPYLGNPSATPSWFDFEDILPAFRNGLATYKGIVYGVPTSASTRLLAYRKDLFEKYGKRPPETVEEFLELARFFNGREKGLYGVAMRSQQGVHFGSGWLTLMYQFCPGFIDQRTLEVTIAAPEAVRSLKYYIELLKNGPPGISNYTHEEARSAFMSGSTAMWLDGTPLTRLFDDPSKSVIAGKVGYCPPPKGPNGAYAALVGWSLGISAQSKKKDAAWAFIVWLLGKPNALKVIEAGNDVTRLSSLHDPRVVGGRPEFYDAFTRTLEMANNLTKKGMRFFPDIPVFGKVLDRAGYYGSLALMGDMTPEQACAAAAKEIEEVVAPLRKGSIGR